MTVAERLEEGELALKVFGETAFGAAVPREPSRNEPKEALSALRWVLSASHHRFLTDFLLPFPPDVPHWSPGVRGCFPAPALSSHCIDK